MRARVVRGGSWNNNRNNARCAVRNRNNPDNFNNNIGFRVALSHDIFPLPEAPYPSMDGGRGKNIGWFAPGSKACPSGKYTTCPFPGFVPETGISFAVWCPGYGEGYL